MKAIFLSAGKGTRMMPLTRNTPKPLLDIGSGVTIIESQLDSIVECGGIDKAVFVIGYRAEQIEAKLNNFDKLPIDFVYNPFYETSNNLISLWFALSEMNDDFVVINGDNLFKPNMLESLLHEEKDRSIVMVIDRKDEYDQEDMKVITRKDKVIRVSKRIPIEEANGESVGMIRFMDNGRKILVNTLNNMVREEASKQIFYLAAIQRIIDQGFLVYCTECDERDWAEVDFHPDLQFIREHMRRRVEDIR